MTPSAWALFLLIGNTPIFLGRLDTEQDCNAFGVNAVAVEQLKPLDGQTVRFTCTPVYEVK